MLKWFKRLFMTTEEKLAEIRKPVIGYDFIDENGVRQVCDLNLKGFQYTIPEDADEIKRS